MPNATSRPVLAARSKWIRQETADSRLPTCFRLFCFPHAGAGLSIFQNWAHALPAGVEVCSIQLPGRENRWAERPIARFTQLVEALAVEIHPWLGVPFGFFGHSMGALLAFELARTMRRGTGETPLHLFMSGARAPHLPELFPPIGHLPDAAFVAALERLKGVPAEVASHAELTQLLLPALRADISVCESYVYRAEPPMDCPISAYGGLSDLRVPHLDLAAWRFHTRAEFCLRLFTGGHFFPATAREELLSVLSKELGAILACCRLPA